MTEDAAPSAAALPEFMTLREALARLPCGRGWLLAYLRDHPCHHGQPTHRRIGNRIIFYPADFERLKDSFQPRPAPKPEPSISARREYERATGRLTAGNKRKVPHR